VIIENSVAGRLRETQAATAEDRGEAQDDGTGDVAGTPFAVLRYTASVSIRFDSNTKVHQYLQSK
jgi:hypothetical protein